MEKGGRQGSMNGEKGGMRVRVEGIGSGREEEGGREERKGGGRNERRD